MKKAFITGITGQDGSYLAEFLLSKGYEVHGLVRRVNTTNIERIGHLFVDPRLRDRRLFLHQGDLSDSTRLTELVYNTCPDEIYHLGAQSHVRVSFDMPEHTADITALSTIRLLEAIRKSGFKARFYQASSSEMFGAASPPQNETTPFYPRSPYAIAKVHAYWITVNYRDGYQMFACNGILFNHESPRRGEMFVTKKITQGIANIISGKQQKLFLGNLSAKRDWGYAPEYVECQWRILQQDRPDDYVIGTGESHTVEEFAREAFAYAGLDWHKHVEIDSQFFRPTEVNYLQADISKAKKQLDWTPKITFHDLVKIMVDADLKAAGLRSPNKGSQVIQEKGMIWVDHHTV